HPPAPGVEAGMTHKPSAAAAALRKLWQQDWPGGRRPGPLVYSPSGEQIALGSTPQFDQDTGDSLGALTIFGAADGGIVHQAVDDWVVGQLAFSPDGRQLMTAEQRFQETKEVTAELVRVRDVATFTLQASHVADFQNQTPVFGPGGRLLAIDSFDLTVLDVLTGAERWRASRGNPGLAWSPDAASLAAGWEQDGSTAMAVLDAGSGVPRLVTPSPGLIEGLAFTPDGRTIVAGARV